MTPRFDFDLISSWIPEGARVLDLGCGDGELLAGLAATRGVKGYGVEIDAAHVTECLKNDVNVLQMDLEDGLAAFADSSFDYVILSQTLAFLGRRHEQGLRALERATPAPAAEGAAGTQPAAGGAPAVETMFA